MNVILVAGTVSRVPFALGNDGLVVLAALAVIGATLLVFSAAMLRKHAPRACPVRRNLYAAGPR
ncbi:MAG: hypothetical protein SF051_01085 [Elusimicrobiota bacterium]|nr:hypothetical protein [Elusimicrobiota bacterium]